MKQLIEFLGGDKNVKKAGLNLLLAKKLYLLDNRTAKLSQQLDNTRSALKTDLSGVERSVSEVKSNLTDNTFYLRNKIESIQDDFRAYTNKLVGKMPDEDVASLDEKSLLELVYELRAHLALCFSSTRRPPLR